AQAIEEIVVTTRRKEESLQEVPIAVTAIGSQQIERLNITNLFQIAELDPSVNFDTSYGPGDTRVSIRGLSNTRGRSNVAFLVDGVDVTSENQIAAGSGLLVNQRLLSDVERIEVVKGPQSALYGRSAFAGAIAYTTKNPTEVLTGNVGLNVAEDDEYQLTGSVSGPIVESLGYRLDGVGWKEHGRYENSVSGGQLGGGEGWGGSGTLRWEPADSFDIKARVSYSEDEYDPRPTVLPLNDSFAAYPEEMWDIDNFPDPENPNYVVQRDDAIGVGSDTFPTDLGVVNHGTFCPDLGVWNDGNPSDPDFANTLPGVAPGTPGICRPGSMGSVSDLPAGKNSATHSETLYGGEQPGATLDLLRATLTMNWDIPGGTLTAIGGYTGAEQTDIHDQDFQAYGRPDRLGINDPFFDYSPGLSIAHQQSDTETDTTQLSGELRFATNFECPVNGTLGYLYWDQEVDTLDRNYIANCQRSGRDWMAGTENVISGYPTIQEDAATGVCDGGPSNFLPGGIQGNTLDNWQDYIRQFLVTDSTVGIDSRVDLTPGRIPGAPWISETEHQSVYGQISWDIVESLRFTGEARYVDERFTILRPNQASCGNIALSWGIPTGFASFTAWVEEGTGNVPDQNCSSVTGAGGASGDWALINASVDDDFIVPKATLEWFISDDHMAYFSWAEAQKPGGFNQLAAGAAPICYPIDDNGQPCDDLTFDPEEMTTWEIGTKTSWDLAGSLIANGAVFFNDYTDKQVTTQVLKEGRLTPRVENAAGAEVWGVELDFNWFPSFAEGLSVRMAYTWQDATYTDFTDFTQSATRTAAYSGCVVVDQAREGALAPNYFCQLDLAGNYLERQAKNAFSGNLGYSRPFPNSTTEWFAEGDASYTDKRYIDQDNYNYFDPYWLVNFRLGLQTDTWDALVFLDNAFDDDTFRTGGPGPDFGLQNSRLGFTAGLGVNGFFGIMPAPRQVGIRTNFRFGG
ncbi:MAG: TonB-dependent receptor, partial [Gammaproteobacteria bacterium]